jgi:hypothetical protein
MTLLDAVVQAGPLPGTKATQAEKKRYSEILSSLLAQEVGKGLRAVGFKRVKPAPGGPGERAFQGGLGPKKVDVSCANEQHGLETISELWHARPRACESAKAAQPRAAVPQATPF